MDAVGLDGNGCADNDLVGRLHVLWGVEAKEKKRDLARSC